MNKIILYITILLCSADLIAQDSLTFQSEEILIKVKHGNLSATLLTPQTDKMTPVVLIIAGSGPTDRDGNNAFMKNNSLKMLAEALALNGIASLRYDKRGIGESKMVGIPEDSLDLEIYIEDAVKCIEQLKAEGFEKIFVAGHSEGSLIGMVAAVQVNIAGYISIAGMGESLYTTLTRQMEPQPEFVRNKVNEILLSLLDGKKVDNVDPMLHSLFRPSVQPFLISFLQYQPTEEIKKVTVPTLIIQGSTDIQVSVEDARKLHEALPAASISIIEGMNHILKDVEINRTINLTTYNQPDLPINTVFIDTITQFILNN
jgi:pimeloyl-ACP methyl ester carboxylesterase